MINRLGLVLILVSGCSEGTKPEPLSRAGAPARPAKIEGEPKPAPPDKAESLYFRIGGEAGFTRIVDQLVADLAESPKSSDLAGRLNKRLLVQFLMTASHRPQPGLADDLALTPADWKLLSPALRLTLIAHGTPEADRDDLLGKIEKSR